MPALILGRLVLVEARRGGLVWLAALALLAGIALSAFLAQLAITESRLLQAAVVAALLRVCAVFLLAAQVVASVRREIDDRRLELMLALPLSRAAQYLGRLAGFIALGFVLAIVFALPLLLWAPAGAVLAWGLSLAFELALVAAAALFFAMSLGQVVSALAATAGLYLLSRSIGAIQAIASGPLAEDSLAHELARRAVDGGAPRHAVPAGLRLQRRKCQPVPPARLRAAHRLARRDPRARSAQQLPALRRCARLRRDSRCAPEPPGAGVRLPRVLRRSGPPLGGACACGAPRQAPAQGPAARPALRRGDPALHPLARRAAMGKADGGLHP